LAVELIIAGVMVVVVPTAALYIILSTPERRAARALRKRPTPIGELSAGVPATIAGSVVGGDREVASLSGSRCAFCRVEVLQLFRRRGTDGNQSESWKPVVTKERGDDFGIDDGTGTVLVRPASALSLLPVHRIEVDGRALPEPVASLIADAGEAVDRRRQTRVEETRLATGDRVVAVGTPRARPDGQLELAAAEGVLFALGASS
jgi:hypothetical protein